MNTPVKICVTCFLSFAVVQAHIFLHPPASGRRLHQGQIKYSKGRSGSAKSNIVNDSHFKTLVTPLAVKSADNSNNVGSFTDQRSLLSQDKRSNTKNVIQRRLQSNPNRVSITEPEVASGISTEHVSEFGSWSEQLDHPSLQNDISQSKRKQHRRQKRAYTAVADRIAHGYGKRTLPSVYEGLGDVSESKLDEPVYSRDEMLSMIETIIADFRQQREDSVGVDSLSLTNDPYKHQSLTLAEMLQRYPGQEQRDDRY